MTSAGFSWMYPSRTASPYQHGLLEQVHCPGSQDLAPVSRYQDLFIVMTCFSDSVSSWAGLPALPLMRQCFILMELGFSFPFLLPAEQ